MLEPRTKSPATRIPFAFSHSRVVAMNRSRRRDAGATWVVAALLAASAAATAMAGGTRSTETYQRMRAYLDSIPAIDTHDHLWPYKKLSNMVATAEGPGVNLASLWQHGYYTWIHKLPVWRTGMPFEQWWDAAKDSFDNARATSFYRYMLPAFQDLYGVDFDTITDEQAKALNDAIFRNYRSPQWVYDVITQRANIELVVNDPYWAAINEVPDYGFCALVFNVSSLVNGYQRPEGQRPGDNIYGFADKQKMEIRSLDDYLRVLDALFQERQSAGAVCLKSTLAYQRTLQFDNVPREKAEAAFGKKREELTPAQIKDFQDFIMWRIVELAAKFDLPFQIHTGQARIQGSNPMLLVDMIEANPKTKFILFHGGYPWVGETAVIAQRNTRNVWVDSCWLPTLSYETGKRAYHEWLDAMPSNKIMWGADGVSAEAVYGAAALTRQCLAEVLAERIDRGDLREDDAKRIGRQILRDNALEIFPSLRQRLWKDKYATSRPSTTP